MRASWSLAPPTSSAPPNWKDLCRGEETRKFNIFSFLEIFFAAVAPRQAYFDRLNINLFLSEVRSLGLADATVFSRLPCFAGRHRPDRPSVLLYSVAAFSCPPLFAGRPHAPCRGIAPILVADCCIYIPVIYLVFLNSARLLFSPVGWKEGCWGV